MKKTSKVLWGMALIAVGAIMGLKAMNLIDFDIFFDGWWTLFIIVPCFIALFNTGDRTWCIIGMAVGVLLLLSSQDIISIRNIWRLIVPAIIVIIGLRLIFKDSFDHKANQVYKEMTDKGVKVPSCTATFSSQNLKLDNELFEGMVMDAIFGGIDCDLRNANIQNDCVIKTCALFGGIEIKVPDNVNVKTSSTMIFGGCDCKKHINSKDNTVTVYINATGAFGGVEIK